MKIKWVCPVCSSTNICEKTDHMECFVCKTTWDGMDEKKEKISLAVKGNHIKEKIKEFFSSIKSAFFSEAEYVETREIMDWEMRRAPLDSKEAYIEATPIYRDISSLSTTETPPEREVIPESTVTAHSESERRTIPSHISGLSEDITPWPEHCLKFDFDRLRSTGCVEILKENISGSKCYKLKYRNGTERVLSLTNMKLMRYLVDVDDASKDHGESGFIDATSTPWSEHRIRFNMEKLTSSNCVNVVRTELGGKKCYKLIYRNGTERVMTVANMKLMGYANDL